MYVYISGDNMGDDNDENKKIQKVTSNDITLHSERITRVEVRVDAVENVQSHMQTTLERQTETLAKIADRQSIFEMTALAIKERTDQHTKTIESLQAESVNTGKILEAFKTQWEILKAIALVTITLVMGYLFSHLVR